MLEKLYKQGQQWHSDKKKHEETTKVGVFRAGNTGVYLESEGKVWGACGRQTLLRTSGIDIKDAEDVGEGLEGSKELMFEAGVTNENSWVENLRQVWDGIILTEEDIPTKWFTESDIPVTGRPDIVLAKPKEVDGKIVHELIHGGELKLVCSVWTARDVLMGKPKAMHVMQAAHYSWQLGISFDLLYSSRVNWHILEWMKNLFPKQGTLGSELMVWEEKPNSKTGVKEAVPTKLLPFVSAFELTWGVNGNLFYRHKLNNYVGKWTETKITQKGIKDYYEYLAYAKAEKILPDRPAHLDINGKKLNYKICNYCPLSAVCDKYEDTGYDKWFEEVNNFINNKKE